MEKFVEDTKSWILNVFIFLFPLFFLPLTQDYFITAKFYLLVLTVLILILFTGLEIILTKKIVWQKISFDNLLLLFLVAFGLSVLISSPNKIQALLNPNFGLVVIFTFVILYFYLSRLKTKHWNSLIKLLSISLIILSLITIIFFFQPLKNVSLPTQLAFLKSPTFTPVGGQIELAIFLGFFVVLELSNILQLQSSESTRQSFFDYLIFIIYLLALSLVLYSIFRPVSNLQPPTSTTQLPPFRISWYAAVETLKNPLTAIFGVGVDNFPAIFTRVKDIAYNQSSLWQINFFTISRSFTLQVITEAGLFGLVALGLLLATLINTALKLHQTGLTQSDNGIMKSFNFIVYYLLFIILFFPSSLIVWFLFFLTISQLANYELSLADYEKQKIDLVKLIPIYVTGGLLCFIFVITFGYFLGRSFLAEAYFKKSIDGYLANSAKQIYDNQRQAIILNPFIERYHISFSQTNLLIANNIASKVTHGKSPQKLSEQDRQTLAQAIQAAIAEAKTAVALNQQKSAGWENLANIYRAIINIAQGADVWTISSYQRAIIADPQNPRYRLGLGGVYYAAGKWDQAIQLFQQAVVLKPDWPNAYYNLAWSYYQKKDYQQAVTSLENVLKLINPVSDKNDYEKAQAELATFRKKLPEQEKQTSQSGVTKENLKLPSPAPQITPKIELPKNASPEAR